MKEQGERTGCLETSRGILKSIFVFIVVFAAVTAVIQVDTQASNAIGNASVFTSSFIRLNQREVEVKILGFETLLSGGLAVDAESGN